MSWSNLGMKGDATVGLYSLVITPSHEKMFFHLYMQSIMENASPQLSSDLSKLDSYHQYDMQVCMYSTGVMFPNRVK